MTKRKWTQQEEETLIRLYEDPKVFPKDIAKMLGRTLPQVYNKARAMGLNAPIERLRMAGKIGTQHPKSGGCTQDILHNGQCCVPGTTHGRDGNHLTGGK